MYTAVHVCSVETRQSKATMPKDNSFFPKRKRRAASGGVHVSVLALMLFGSLSSPGDGMVRITLLTQVKKERKER